MSESGYVYYQGGLTATERDKVIAAFQGLLHAAIHYSPNQIQFVAWQPANLAENGRAFGPEVEVRWRPETETTWEMLVISEKAQKSVANWALNTMRVDTPQSEKTQDPSTTYLWGEHWHSLHGAGLHLPHGWVQARIAADLQYPVSDGGQQKPLVQVQTRNYRQQSVIRLTRFVTVQAVAKN